ncbi:MAG: hypothetical protein GTO40_01290 [Deltaproteobacteria bacterium]|nr:hypothetical protein [Deltaproteobacteria bacterium]
MISQKPARVMKVPSTNMSTGTTVSSATTNNTAPKTGHLPMPRSNSPVLMRPPTVAKLFLWVIHRCRGTMRAMSIKVMLASAVASPYWAGSDMRMSLKIKVE